MKPGKCLHQTSIDITGHEWNILYWPGDVYKKLHGDTSRAVTITRLKQMHFNCSAVYYKDNVAVHELVHAYATELGHHDLDKSADQIEEFFCVLMETRGAEILRQAKPLTKLLHRYARKCREDDADDSED